MTAGRTAPALRLRLRTRQSWLLLTVVGLLAGLGLSGCNSSGNAGSGPAVVGTLTDAPDTGQAGTGRAGDIVAPKGSYVRVEHGVSLRLDITNTGATPDELVGAVSDVSGAGTLSPDPIPIPARGTVHVGAGATTITLPVTQKLDSGQTLAVTLTFARSGQLLVYALTSS
jgi:hypothetical protein